MKNSDILVTIKKRGPKGRFRQAKSLTLEEINQTLFTCLSVSQPAVRWYDKLFKTRRYIHHERVKSYHHGVVDTAAELQRLIKNESKDRV